MTPANPPQDAAPVVVTFREINRILTGTEAVGNIEEAAQVDDEASPVEKATVMAAVGNVLRQLQEAEEEADALVMTTAQHGPASRLQSLIASGEGGTLDLTPLASGGLEAKFDTSDWFGWAQVAWVKLKALARGKSEQLKPIGSVPDPLPDEARVALLGDWGTGLYGAPVMARTIEADASPYTMLMHLGDVYYSGTHDEVEKRFLGIWPDRPEAIDRALNSNHEMYSGGQPYFARTLPRFAQASSYFAMQNSAWTLVGLDTAYKDHDLDDEQVAWLERILGQAGDRKVILFSHHQLYSHFEGQGEDFWKHDGFRRILESGRIHAWYWGHEHRCTIFEGVDSRFGLRARCIGASGMPQSRRKTRNLPQATEPEYGVAEWRRSAPCNRKGNDLPACVVLEGSNPFIKGEEDKFSPHSYAVLTFDGPDLREQILSPTGAVLYDQPLT